MKKFFAVLVAVALLGVAGAAFAADDAGHAGHLNTTALSIDVPAAALTELSTSFGSTVSALAATNISGDFTPSVTGVVPVGLAWLKNLSAGTSYAVSVNLSAMADGDIVSGTLKLYDALRTSDLALAAGVTGKFYTSAYKETTTPSTAKYAVFTAGGTQAQLYAAGTTNPGGPTSNKGSGGCNAGFASLAVLALGALTLRRKVR